MSYASNRRMKGDSWRSGIHQALLVLLVLAMASGCGGKVVRVTGQVLVNGQAYRLGDGECIQIEIFSVDPAVNPPMALVAYATSNGTFAADQNDGTGRGIPPGKYKIKLNRETTTLKQKASDRLFREGSAFEAVQGAPVHLTIDLVLGTIAP